MTPPSIKLLALAASIVLIGGGLYAIGEGWAPWADGPSSATAPPDPSARTVGIPPAPDSASSATPSRPTTLVVHSRYELQGVVAGATPDAPGLALIAVDGAPARTVRVGEVLGDGLALLGVSPGGALLGPPGGPAVMALAVVVGSAAPGGPGARVTPDAAQVAGQFDPSVSATPMPLTPGSKAPTYSAAGDPGDPGGAMAAGAGAGQVLAVPANDLVIDTTHGGRPLKHPGRHQRLQSVKPGS